MDTPARVENVLRFSHVRDAVQFTIVDAGKSMPAYLAVAGFFIGGIVVLMLIKWLLERILLKRENHLKYIVQKYEPAGDGSSPPTRKLLPQRYNYFGNIKHMIILILFFFGIIVTTFFAFSLAGIYIWTSTVGATLIGVVATYTFSHILSLLGDGMAGYSTNAISVGDYWEVNGNSSVSGWVSRLTLMWVELENFEDTKDPMKKTAKMYRVPWSSFVSGITARDYAKELEKDRPSMMSDDPKIQSKLQQKEFEKARRENARIYSKMEKYV